MQSTDTNLTVSFITLLIAFLIIATMVITLPSCEPEWQKSLYERQEKLIEQFVETTQKKDPDIKAHYNNGTVRLSIKEGDPNKKADENSSITFFYALYNFSNGQLNANNLIDTNNEQVAINAGWDLSDKSIYQEKTIKLNDKDILPGLKSAFLSVNEKEECILLFSGRYAYGNKEMSNIPANSALLYYIWVESVK